MLAVRSLLFNLCFIAWTAIASLLALPVAFVINRPRWLHILGRLWVRVTFALLKVLCRIDYQVHGLENLPAGPCMIAAKHQSAWDTMIFSLLLERPSFVFKQELTRIPLFGWALTRAEMVPVDRAGGTKALKSMVATARRRLQAGCSIVIFPEGTRMAPGQQRPYHPGVAALYRELGVPVVPVALNSGLFWGRRSFLKRPGRIRLELLKPIPPGSPRREFMARLEQEIEGASRRLIEDPGAGKADEVV